MNIKKGGVYMLTSELASKMCISCEDCHDSRVRIVYVDRLRSTVYVKPLDCDLGHSLLQADGPDDTWKIWQPEMLKLVKPEDWTMLWGGRDNDLER